MSSVSKKKKILCSFKSFEEFMKNTLKHVAIVMDGNRRWAKEHNLSGLEGHEKGAQTLREIVEESIAQKIHYLTVYAFSTENWNRGEAEVHGLFSLMTRLLKSEAETLHERGVKLKVIGNYQQLPKEVCTLIQEVEELTQHNTALQLTVALNYGGRRDIIGATQKIAQEVLDRGLDIASITEEMMGSYLDTADMPDPDLFIRPSGEFRISNFLLWEIAYSEFYFTPTYWPDFSREEYGRAIASYENRQRRFGE
jgi:undecaprenyl diphosphate synthase